MLHPFAGVRRAWGVSRDHECTRCAAVVVYSSEVMCSLTVLGSRTFPVAMCATFFFFFFQAEDGIRDLTVTGVQTCALPICGGRLGYFFSNVVSAEFDAGYQSPNPKTGSASPTLAHGSASLVLNFGTARNLFYILGGYSRLDFEKTAPYRFTDDAVHGAIGDRIFLGDRAALRFEVRGFYTPNTGFAGGDWAGHVVGSLGLSIFTRGGA